MVRFVGGLLFFGLLGHAGSVAAQTVTYSFGGVDYPTQAQAESAMRAAHWPAGVDLYPCGATQGSPKELHHWLIERNSWIGKRVPDALKNHPSNLNPVSPQTHKILHRLDPASRTVIGAPRWAKSAGTSIGSGLGADAANYGGCKCD